MINDVICTCVKFEGHSDVKLLSFFRAETKKRRNWIYIVYSVHNSGFKRNTIAIVNVCRMKEKKKWKWKVEGKLLYTDAFAADCVCKLCIERIIYYCRGQRRAISYQICVSTSEFIYFRYQRVLFPESKEGKRHTQFPRSHFIFVAYCNIYVTICIFISCIIFTYSSFEIGRKKGKSIVFCLKGLFFYPLTFLVESLKSIVDKIVGPSLNLQCQVLSNHVLLFQIKIINSESIKFIY